MNGQKSTIHDIEWVDLQRIQTERGDLTVYPNASIASFPVKRVYYLYDIPSGSERGGHAHHALEQIIVAVTGAFEIVLEDGREQVTIVLHQPHMGLKLPPGLWRSLQHFSGGATCLVLASDAYDEGDYIRDYSAFKNWKNETP